MQLLLSVVLLFSAETISQIKISQAAFDSLQFRKDIEILASDSLAGRGTGQPGGIKAASYIAQELAACGITPAFEENSFFQNIPMQSIVTLPDSRLALSIENSEILFRLNDDYVLNRYGEETFTPDPMPLVFAGYGIAAPEYDYDDYHSIDASGKIVVVLEGEPFSNSPGFFLGQQLTIYSSNESKLRMALAHGAEGIIIIPNIAEGTGFSTESSTILWDAVRAAYAHEEIQLAYHATGKLSILLNPASASALFAGSGYELADVFALHSSGVMRSFPLPGKITFRGKFKQREFRSPNIVGFLPGIDSMLSGSFLLLCAHYDHIGTSVPVQGDSVYNGLYDNAAGVAVLLGLARAFAKQKINRRTIIFLFTTGEEKGLLGSQYYVDNPVFPLYQTIAAVNIDGIAMIDTFDDILGVGKEYSTLSEFLEETAETLSLTLSEPPEEYDPTESFFLSDQIQFSLAGIPSILVVEGTQYRTLGREEGIRRNRNYMRKFYHTPFDDLRQTVCMDAVLQHAGVLAAFVKLLSCTERVPEWNPLTPFLNERLRTKAEKR